MVTSWTDGKQDSLEFFIQPRKGFTRKLLIHAESSASRLVWFSGPHGKTASLNDYENVFMIADGFGIVAHLPYLTQLIKGYNARKVCTRRIHLVWQIEDIGKPGS
jgi:NAD(P)H-flavin reductase